MTSVKVLILCFVAVGAVSGSARAANPIVVMETSMGSVKIELFEEKAPVTVKNFLKYVEDKHYDGTTFHRVKPDFMIQGGGFEPGKLAKNEPKPTRDPIKNESSNGLSNLKGTLAMARTPQADSATSQFFINVKDNTGLDKAKEGTGYCVFGRVIEGLDVVEKIKDVETTSVGQHDDVPKKDVVIKSIRLVKQEKK